MSDEVFAKSCYTSRSAGYKYRTHTTNTGYRKSQDPEPSKDSHALDKKFRELRREIVSRVVREARNTHKARDLILTKFKKVDSKVNSMLELQDTVNALRKDLHNAGNALLEMCEKVDKIERYTTRSEMFSLQSQRTSFRSHKPIKEENEDTDSIVTHI